MTTSPPKTPPMIAPVRVLRMAVDELGEELDEPSNGTLVEVVEAVDDEDADDGAIGGVDDGAIKRADDGAFC